jgi:WD40 repeat protein
LLLSAASDAALLTDMRMLIPAAVFQDHSAPVTSADIDSEANQVVTATEDGHIHLWDARADNRQFFVANKEFVSEKGYSTAWTPLFSFCSQFKILAVSTQQHYVRFFDLETFAETTAVALPTGPVTALHMAEDGATLWTGCEDGTCLAIDMMTKTATVLLQDCYGRSSPSSGNVASTTCREERSDP